MGCKQSKQNPNEIYQAASAGRNALIEHLLEAPEAQNYINLATENKTPLMAAAEKGFVEACKALVKGGAQLEKTVDSDFETALIKAAVAGQAPVVKELLKLGANPEATCGEQNETALIKVMRAKGYGERHYAALGALLEGGANPDAPDAKGETALAVAAKRRQYAAAKLLLGAGPRGAAAADRPRAQDGLTPLMIAAAKKKDEGIVKLLIEKGADPNIKNTAGETALMMFINAKTARARKASTSASPSPKAGNEGGSDAGSSTPTPRASPRPSFSDPNDQQDPIVHLLTYAFPGSEKKPNLNLQDAGGRTALLLCARGPGLWGVAAALVGASGEGLPLDLDLPDAGGDAPLAAAVARAAAAQAQAQADQDPLGAEEALAMVKLLVDAGADKKRKGAEGKSALELARAAGGAVEAALRERPSFAVVAESQKIRKAKNQAYEDKQAAIEQMRQEAEEKTEDEAAKTQQYLASLSRPEPVASVKKEESNQKGKSELESSEAKAMLENTEEEDEEEKEHREEQKEQAEPAAGEEHFSAHVRRRSLQAGVEMNEQGEAELHITFFSWQSWADAFQKVKACVAVDLAEDFGKPNEADGLKLVPDAAWELPETTGCAPWMQEKSVVVKEKTAAAAASIQQQKEALVKKMKKEDPSNNAGGEDTNKNPGVKEDDIVSASVVG